MHSVKRRARRLAWKPEGGGVYNPFGPNPLTHTNSRGDVDPTQRPHHRTQSEPMVPSNIDERGEIDPVSPIHPNTMGARIPSEYREDGPTSNYDSRTTTDSTKIPRTNESNDSPTSDDPILNGRGKMRQRIGRFTKHKEEKEDNTDLEKQKTSQSKKSDQKFTFWGTMKATVFRSWINILLFCVPIGIALKFANLKGTAKVALFVVNFCAIIPLAGLLSYATEEIAMRVGETLGGLLNASFGNAVELIVSILALVQGEIIIVKTSLVGSMLSNLLLVMGMCFFFGGLKREEQFFNITVAQTASSLLALAIGSIIIPTVFRDWSSTSENAAQEKVRRGNAVPLSRGVAVILLFIYACYLWFQLRTHSSMYNEKSAKGSPRRYENSVEEGAVKKGAATAGASTAAAGNGDQDLMNSKEEAVDDDEEVPEISMLSAIITLCVSTAFVGWCAEYMVEGIATLTKVGNISPEFVGLILIPIVGNAAEHATALTVAIKDKMDLAIGVAVGSSLQIVLLVLPFSVVVGWGLGKDSMNLVFDGFLVAVLFVAVLLVNYLIGDGRSHWLEGMLLMCLYIIIAVAAWFYPASQDVVG